MEVFADDELEIIEAVRRMSEGELLQIQKARSFDATEDTYFKVISDKTASLIKTCCKLGALSASKDKSIVDKLGTFGENIGISFQLRDDILDYTGRKKLLGKSTGNDLKEKKFTLPLIVSLRNAPKQDNASFWGSLSLRLGGLYDKAFYKVLGQDINFHGIRNKIFRSNQFKFFSLS